MKASRLIPIILIFLVSATAAAALPQWFVWVFNLCDDTDDGPKAPENPLPYIGIPAHTKTANEKQFDECLDEQGRPAKFGRRIRERFCGDQRQILSKVYDCLAYEFEGCVNTTEGAACVREPTTFCGDGAIQAGEQCDPPGGKCFLGGKQGVCNGACKCIVKKPKCGDKKVDPFEQCDPPGSKCKDAKGNDGVCNAKCGCDVKPKHVCGDKVKDAGEECDPPGDTCVNAAGLRSTCDKNCKCPVTRVPTFCSNNRVDAWEDCDPPGTPCKKFGQVGVCNQYCKCPVEPTQPPPKRCGNERIDRGENCDPPGSFARNCPPILMPGGGCAIPLCTKDCQCPKGTPCRERAVTGAPEPKDAIQTEIKPMELVSQQPVDVKPKSCEELCKERGRTTRQTDHTSYIQSFLQQHSCVSGANIRMAGALTITGPGISCKCYSADKPEITINKQKPVCSTPCGNVACGETKSCPCPDRENCVLTASCTWQGWRFQGERAIPIVGGEAKQTN